MWGLVFPAVIFSGLTIIIVPIMKDTLEATVYEI
jgi:hypothetical protein